MGMTSEEMQSIIDESRNKLAEDKARKDVQIKNTQENIPVKAKEAVEQITPVKDKEDSVLDYAVEEGKVIGLSAVGVGELALEFGTGMFGAFAGTSVGAGRELWDNDTISKNGEMFMETFQDYTDAMTYQPRTVQGQAISKWAQSFFQKFQEYGDQAGDAAFEATGDPLVATAVETAISGAPIYAPFVGGKVVKTRKNYKSKLARRQEILDAAKDNTDIPLDKTTIDPKQLAEGNRRLEARESINIDTNIITTETATGIEGLKRLIDRVTPDTQKIQNVREQKKLDKKLKELKKQESNSKQKSLGLEEFPLDKNKNIEPHPDVGSKLFDVDSNARADKVRATQEASKKASISRIWPSWRQVGDKLMETTVDSSSGLRRRILAGISKEQNRMLEVMYNRIAGSTPAAQMRYQRSEQAITQGMSKVVKGDGFSIDNFNSLADSMRIIQIASIAKEKNVLPPRNSGGLSAVDHIHALSKMEKSLGSKVFQKLQKRVGELHKTYSRLLEDLYVEGFLTKDRFNAAKDTIYSPRQFLETIDPKTDSSLSITEYQFNPFSKKVKVNDSGLQELSKGDIALMEVDQMQLLQEYTVRVTNNIWRNQANVKLLDWVKDNPNNGWARLAKEGEKVNKGTGQIDAWVDGKKTTILMDKPLALQWVGNTYVMGHGLSNLIRTLSGQVIMKPLTTGMSPEFALKLFPVDVVHAYFATEVFSASAPIYTMQLGKTLSVTMKDAFFKGERFKNFIDEGGGMNFLTHQGTDVFGGKGIIRKNTSWRKAKEVLSFLNEGFEIWVRLAIREQAINNFKAANLKKNGVETLSRDQLLEATAIAREQMDFSRGGTMTKALDTGLPYLNAVTVAMSSTAKAAVRGGKGEKVLGVNKKFAYKVFELSSISASLAMLQELSFPELFQNISEDEKAKNWIIPTGRSYRDKNGNVRYTYVKIRKDNLVAGLTNPAEMAMRNYITGVKPDDQTLAYFKALTPIVPVELSTPTGAALHTYAYNHDFWGNPIWNNQELDVDIAREQEFTSTSLNKAASSLFWKDVGNALGKSPKLLEKSFQSIAPDNTYLFGGALAYKYLIKGMDSQADVENSFEQQLKETPFLRHHLRITHPATKVMADSLRPRTRSQVFRKIQRDNLDQLMAEKVSGNIIEQWIKQQPPEDISRLFNSYLTKMELRKIFNGQDMSLNIPGPYFWNFVASEIKNPVEKGEALYWEWRDMPTNEDRTQFMRIANRLSVNLQIWPSTTMKEFRRLQQDSQYGKSFFSDQDSGVFKNRGRRFYQNEIDLTKEQEHLERTQKQIRLMDEAMQENKDMIEQGLLPDPQP